VSSSYQFNRQLRIDNYRSCNKFIFPSIDGSSGLIVTLRVNRNCTKITTLLHHTLKGVTWGWWHLASCCINGDRSTSVECPNIKNRPEQRDSNLNPIRRDLASKARLQQDCRKSVSPTSILHVGLRLSRMPSQGVQPGDAGDEQGGLSVRAGHRDLPTLFLPR